MAAPGSQAVARRCAGQNVFSPFDPAPALRVARVGRAPPPKPESLNNCGRIWALKAKSIGFRKKRTRQRTNKKSFNDNVEIVDSKKSRHDMNQVIRWLPEDLY